MPCLLCLVPLPFAAAARSGCVCPGSAAVLHANRCVGRLLLPGFNAAARLVGAYTFWCHHVFALGNFST